MGRILLLITILSQAVSAQPTITLLRSEITGLEEKRASKIRDSLLCEKYQTISNLYRWTPGWIPFKPDSSLYYVNNALKVATGSRQRASCLLLKGDIYNGSSWGMNSGWISVEYLSQSIRLFAEVRDRDGVHRAANSLYVYFLNRYNGDILFNENQLLAYILAMEAQTGKNFIFPTEFKCDTTLLPVKPATLQRAIKATTENLAFWKTGPSRQHVMWRSEVLGFLIYHSGTNKPLAYAHLNNAITLAKELKEYGIIIGIIAHFAIWQYKDGAPRKSVSLARDGFNLAKRLQLIRKEAVMGNILYKSYLAMAMNDSAYYFKDRSLAIMDSLSLIDEKKQLEFLQAKNDAEKQQTFLENQLEEQNQLRNFTLIALLILSISVIYVVYNNRKLSEKNKEISAALLRGQTTERKRVAAELHDNLGSSLSAIKWNLLSIDQRKMEKTERDIYSNVVEMISSAYDNVRALSHNMLPEELEKEGLNSALVKLVKKLNQSGQIEFTYQNLANPVKLNENQAFQLYNIVLELSNNILKHSGARLACIEIEQDSDKLYLRVWDNGNGFDKKVFEKGKGISNIESRVNSLKGNLTYQSSADSGTKFEATIPLQ